MDARMFSCGWVKLSMEVELCDAKDGYRKPIQLDLF